MLHADHPPPTHARAWATSHASHRFAAPAVFGQCRFARRLRAASAFSARTCPLSCPLLTRAVLQYVLTRCRRRHSNVLRAIAMGTHEGLPFLVLEKLSQILAAELPKLSDAVVLDPSAAGQQPAFVALASRGQGARRRAELLPQNPSRDAESSIAT